MFPIILKLAKETPIDKKGNKDQRNNYRPMPINVCVYERIYSFLDQSQIIYIRQFEVRSNLEKNREAFFDKGLVACVFF